MGTSALSIPVLVVGAVQGYGKDYFKLDPRMQIMNMPRPMTLLFVLFNIVLERRKVVQNRKILAVVKGN